MKKTIFIAKENGTTLEEHIYNALEKTESILKISGINNSEIEKISKVSAIVHDCGKTCAIFQNYIKNGVENEIIHRHNEIGFALLSLLIDKSYGFNGKNELIELVKNTTLYHHELFNKESTIYLEEYYTIDELKEVAIFFNEQFKKYKLDYFIRFKEDICEEMLEDGIKINNKIFEFIKKTTMTSETKKMLKNFETVFNTVRYADLIVSQNYTPSIYRINKHITLENFIKPSHFDNKRWEDQYQVAKNCYSNHKNICIVDATMGWGKTICGLMYLLQSNKKGFWICPDNSLTKSTYNNIVEALEICGLNEIRVARIISGSIIGNWGEDDIKIEDADIIVSNIDSCLNGIVRNSRKDISYEVLFSNCIFDEFHEYAFMNTPISPRFISMIDAKRELSNVKTLLLSGTSINEKNFVNVDDSSIFKAGDYLAKLKKLNIRFISQEDYLKNYLNTPNSLHISTNIESCQKIFKDEGMDFCYHSAFDDKDSLNIKQGILSCNGKHRTKEYSITSSTSIVTRGEDMSFKNVFITNPTPYQLLQITGRAGNRWDFSVTANIYIVISENSKDYAIYEDFWERYYLPHINNVKKIISEKDYDISVYELNEITNKFFTENKDTKISYRNIIKSNYNNGIKELTEIEFSKGKSISIESTSDIKFIKDGIDIRGKSETRFFSYQIDGQDFGVMSGAINTPYYRLDKKIKNFNELKTTKNYPNIMCNIKRFFEENPDKMEKYGIKMIKKWKDNNLFDYLLNLAKCSETPFPLLCGYGYNSKLGSYKK